VKEGKDKQLQQTFKWKWPSYGQVTVSWTFWKILIIITYV